MWGYLISSDRIDEGAAVHGIRPAVPPRWPDGDVADAADRDERGPKSLGGAA